MLYDYSCLLSIISEVFNLATQWDFVEVILLAAFLLCVALIGVIILILQQSLMWVPIRRKKTPVEAGFSPLRIFGGFSIQFIFISLLFILFDMEILLLLRWVYLSSSWWLNLIVWRFLLGSWAVEWHWNKLDWEN